ncbi:MFS transporter [Escherichia coli]|nr:MFS transporter [Escherichia coli]EKG4019417.1 MFS transporter [Escherichia coli]
MSKRKVAIIGSGNIGTDLMIKILRHGQHLEMAVMVGIDPQSDGLARARRMGVATTHEGVIGLMNMPEFADIDIVFDATSAGAHVKNDAALREAKPDIRLIDLTPEAAGPRFRGTAVSLMYCGVPIGAALAATLGFAGANLAWQTVFWVGGVVPLILVPLLMRWLPESAVFAGEKQAAPPLRALFAPETATATLLLWLCYFFTLLVVYMLINWLPLLLVEQGFQPSQAAGVMFALQMGAASGTLMLGALMDKLRPVTMSLLIYSGMLASLLALGTVSSFNGMLLAGFVAGLFATGGQSVLYALAPLFYSSQIRATGVGTAVAVGRLGAMSGPLLAGKMLALGTGTVGVMAASAPGILVAGLAVFILMSRRSRMQPCADA